MDFFTFRTSKFETCSSLALSILGENELQTLTEFVRALTYALRTPDKTCFEPPNLVIAGLRFQTTKKVIPVVELYYVLDQSLKHGAGKVVLSEKDPGYYNCVCRASKRRLQPSLFKKTGEKLLINEVRKIIHNRSDDFPSDILKITFLRTAISLEVLFRFRDCTAPSLAIALIPAIAGADLPEGTNNLLQDLVRYEYEGDGKEACWFLVPPPTNRRLDRYSWELTIPNICNLVPDFRHVLPAMLLLSYVAEVRQWRKFGLQAPYRAIFSSAAAIGPHLHLMDRISLEEQISILIGRMIIGARAGCISDFGVPSRNYLGGTSKLRRLRFASELQKACEHLSTLVNFLENYVGGEPHNPESNESSYDECCKSEASNDTDYSVPSRTSEDSLMNSARSKDSEASGGKSCTDLRHLAKFAKSRCGIKVLKTVRENSDSQQSKVNGCESLKSVLEKTDPTHYRLILKKPMTMVFAMMAVVLCLAVGISNCTENLGTKSKSDDRGSGVEYFVCDCDTEDGDCDSDSDSQC